MQRDIEAFYFDIRTAIDAIELFTRAMDAATYQNNLIVRSAVERQFIIIGEALASAIRLDPDVEQHVADARQIIAFRHILVHGYAAIQHDIVWQSIHQSLPVLRREVQALSKENQKP